MASKGANGNIGSLAGSYIGLPSFIYFHRDCPIVVMDEHQREEDRYDENIEWDNENFGKLVERNE